MKTSFFSKSRTLGTLAVAAVSLMSLTPDSYGWDRERDRGPSRKPSFDRHDDHHHHDDDARRRFFSYPRTNFVVTLGTGYAGRGYYYGPPNAPYYYEGSGVSYYKTRERVPQQYWRPVVPVSRYPANEIAVQRALAQRGYYRGPIDGALGKGTKAAIARYQDDKGLAVTGNINVKTLRSLGIY